MLNVVILNGGRGAGETIPALLSHPELHVTSIVNAYDDGKSTGEIRRFFGMLGPSDIRKVQELMLPKSDVDYKGNLKLFQYRFPSNCSHSDTIKNLKLFVYGTCTDLAGIELENVKVKRSLKLFIREFLTGLSVIEKVNGEKFNFSDCSIMNCIYAGAFLAFNRNIEQVTVYIDRLFKLRGTVLPTSIENKKLFAQRENGDILYSEAEIVELRSNVRIDRIYLLDNNIDKSKFELLDENEKKYYLKKHHCYVSVSSGVRLALQQADIIIYSAGTQHSSLYPTYLSDGLAQSIADNHSAYKVFITNIGADYETPSYKASDHIIGAYKYLNLAGNREYSMDELFDINLINKNDSENSDTYVEFDEENFANISTPYAVDIYESSSFLGKHDGDKIVKTILGLYDKET